MTAPGRPGSLEAPPLSTEHDTPRFPFSIPPWAVALVRVALILMILGELYVTARVQLPGLLHPTDLGTDTSNYFAAAQRLNAGHNLYGPLLATDRPVPGYPALYPAPILSPPLSAVLWRPLAALGDVSMTIWWAVDLAFVAILAIWFVLIGRRVTLGGILGHALCTGAAVMGGKHLATHIDERLVAICGGLLFLAFGAHSLWSGVPE